MTWHIAYQPAPRSVRSHASTQVSSRNPHTENSGKYMARTELQRCPTWSVSLMGTSSVLGYSWLVISLDIGDFYFPTGQPVVFSKGDCNNTLPSRRLFCKPTLPLTQQEVIRRRLWKRRFTASESRSEGPRGVCPVLLEHVIWRSAFWKLSPQTARHPSHVASLCEGVRVDRVS